MYTYIYVCMYVCMYVCYKYIFYIYPIMNNIYIYMFMFMFMCALFRFGVI